MIETDPPYLYSYDGLVRIFDKRNALTPLGSHDAGGGVWRVRWHPTDAEKLLTACMHDGFKVLKYKPGFEETETSVRFDAHGDNALAYGSDWAFPITGGGDYVATCSFYDHQMRTWAA